MSCLSPAAASPATEESAALHDWTRPEQKFLSDRVFLFQLHQGPPPADAPTPTGTLPGFVTCLALSTEAEQHLTLFSGLTTFSKGRSELAC